MVVIPGVNEEGVSDCFGGKMNMLSWDGEKTRDYVFN